MQFQISTPETVGAYLAKQASRKALKRNAAQASDVESSTKRQKFLHRPLPSAPAQSDAQAIIAHKPTEEADGVVGTSWRYRALGPDGCPVNDSSAKNSTAEVPKTDVNQVLNPKFPTFARLSPVPDAVTRMVSVSGAEAPCNTPAQGLISTDHPGFGDEISRSQSIQATATEASSTLDGKFDGMCHLSHQTSTSASTSTTFQRPFRPSSDVTVECKTASTNSDTDVSVSSDHGVGYDTVAALSDQTTPTVLDHNVSHDTAATTKNQTTLSFPATISRDDVSLVVPSQIPAVRPAKNKGGRPRTRQADAPKKFKGPARFQKNRPIKARVNVDIWENILLHCSPDFLLKARTFSPTFRSVLKDDSHIWKRARINHFGPDMPDPPAGLSEPQYADLLTRTGCHTRGCESKKTRKTYWVFQKRLCIDCFRKSIIQVSILNENFMSSSAWSKTRVAQSA